MPGTPLDKLERYGTYRQRQMSPARCEHPEVHLRAMITSGGGRQIKFFCDWCEQAMSSALSVKHLRAQGVNVDALPICRSRHYVGEPDYPPCSVRGCDQDGRHLHHWAPRYLFGDDACWNWPTSPLCEEHHREWHRIVTPDMGRKKAS